MPEKKWEIICLLATLTYDIVIFDVIINRTVHWIQIMVYNSIFTDDYKEHGKKDPPEPGFEHKTTHNPTSH